MDMSVFNLWILVAINIVFFFVGTVLNVLVIIVFWRSTYLRKKLCYFMIMVLSCCDLITVLLNNPVLVVIAALFIKNKDNIFSQWERIILEIVSITISSSFLALLVMNIDRYLSVSKPLYHKTNVTKRKLLLLFIALQSINVIIAVLHTEELAYPREINAFIFMVLYLPPMLFINYKLLRLSRKYRKSNVKNREKKATSTLKQISISLMAFAGIIVFSIPVLVFIVYNMFVTEIKWKNVVELWLRTILTMNSTFNCLIFFWKNTILRTEAFKIVKTILGVH
ncbi:probable G-protein coupled receptor 21 [Xenia sp. Carnegie-2017]|uniref:probable G-protein coupled receptor 21 n=1 Tax=Xenia sp. Carnegie-2017 TaxID=2897299 RepID=UPI001F0461F7|nr:probable G-protein coupled receptor 21 [Xenia sp. Carnegie-2017]XP_046839591.1 probable G-protein coupled receptor 21 [Xenia sp. Carnegie-2017]